MRLEPGHEQDTTSDINKGRLYFGDFTNTWINRALKMQSYTATIFLSEKLSIRLVAWIFNCRFTIS
jgi:hypothetical protein